MKSEFIDCLKESQGGPGLFLFRNSCINVVCLILCLVYWSLKFNFSNLAFVLGLFFHLYLFSLLCEA